MTAMKTQLLRTLSLCSSMLALSIGTMTAQAGPPATDPVVLSFERMLNHEPNTLAPPIPAGFEADPLIVAMVDPLRRRFPRPRPVAAQAMAQQPSTLR
jgi:hypothetical protein